MFRQQMRGIRRQLAFGLFAVSTGCGGYTGPELGTVEGLVMIDGQPASQVMIEFQPDGGNGSPSIGIADVEGYYKLQFTSNRHGAMLGTHTVRLTFDDDPSPDWPAHPVQIPAKYNAQSELKAEVKSGKNRHDFHLNLQSANLQSANP